MIEIKNISEKNRAAKKKLVKMGRKRKLSTNEGIKKERKVNNK